MIRAAAAVTVALVVAAPLLAHHGGGTFDSSRAVNLTGKLTKIDFINPHSWIYFDVKGPDGKVKSYRCETRSAHTLRRSGWTKEMFKIGQQITIEGSPDRNDPQSCYLSTIVLQTAAAWTAMVSTSRPAAAAKATARAFTRRLDGRAEHHRRLGAGTARDDGSARPRRRTGTAQHGVAVQAWRGTNRCAAAAPPRPRAAPDRGSTGAAS